MEDARETGEDSPLRRYSYTVQGPPTPATPTVTLPAVAVGVTTPPVMPTKSAEGSAGVPTVVNVIGDAPVDAVGLILNVRLNNVPDFAVNDGIPDGA